MEAVIKVSVFEFDEKLFTKIRSLLQTAHATEITITITTPENTVEDPKAEYLRKIDSAAAELKDGKGTAFTMKEFEEYINKNFPG